MTSKGSPSRDDEVRSGARVMRIVEALAKERRPLAASEISAKLGIPQTSAHRLLATMTSMRWVERKPGRLYQLGSTLLAVAGLGLGSATLVKLADPVMAHIAELSRLDSYLALLIGDGVTFIHRRSGVDSDRPEFKLGALQPAHCTSSGKLLLAFLKPKEQEKTLAGLRLRRFTERTITSVAELREELSRIRNSGYAVDSGEFSEFWRSVALPISNSSGDVVAAVTCGGRPEKMTVEHLDWIRQEMMVLVEELSHQLA